LAEWLLVATSATLMSRAVKTRISSSIGERDQRALDRRDGRTAAAN
jgi:hypothetical protein